MLEQYRVPYVSFHMLFVVNGVCPSDHQQDLCKSYRKLNSFPECGKSDLASNRLQEGKLVEDSLCNVYNRVKPEIVHFTSREIQDEDYSLKEPLKQQQIIMQTEHQHQEMIIWQNVPVIKLDDAVWFCNRGLDMWFHTTDRSRCLCPPSYYGQRCQFQNQRLIISFQLCTFEWFAVFKGKWVQVWMLDHQYNYTHQPTGTSTHIHPTHPHPQLRERSKNL